ncbi:potassium-transporting ATPase subunit KdpA [Kitasatospora sp. NPDC101235]|uniref:potassium-transporting ATPase subunit KdpA n=1 Tax=Kitasatospora sp. NPDC101235 TaxID=3364101 RepID=UPI0037F500C5
MDAALRGYLQALALVAALALSYRPLGDYIAGMLTGRRHLRIERGIYRVIGVHGDVDQSWTGYLRGVLAFSAVSVLFLYAFLRLQNHLWLSLGFKAVDAPLAWNTAVSFVTNTNWQNYSGESTLGHLAQMAGLAVQNFLSAAVGIAVVAALIRGFHRSGTDRVGNFWVDLVRVTIRLLLPVSVVFAVVFVAAGMVENLHAAAQVSTLGGGTQALPGGPVASQEVIKLLGTNGAAVGGGRHRNRDWADHPARVRRPGGRHACRAAGPDHGRRRTRTRTRRRRWPIGRRLGGGGHYSGRWFRGAGRAGRVRRPGGRTARHRHGGRRVASRSAAWSRGTRGWSRRRWLRFPRGRGLSGRRGRRRGLRSRTPMRSSVVLPRWRTLADGRTPARIAESRYGRSRVGATRPSRQSALAMSLARGDATNRLVKPARARSQASFTGASGPGLRACRQPGPSLDFVQLWLPAGQLSPKLNTAVTGA